MDEKDLELNVLRRQVDILKSENRELKARIDNFEKVLNRPSDAQNGKSR